MNNNQVSNPKVEVPTGMSLNDKDYLNCLLSGLKEMTRNYVLAITEASNERLYNIYKGIFDEVCALQREVFELAFKKGWYSLENSEIQKVQQKYQTLNQEFQDLSM